MGKLLERIDEFRRVVLLTTIAVAIISLIGSEMPWVHITQDSNNIHTWNFVSTTTDINNTETSISTELSCNYTLEIYLSLYDAEICQKFQSGYLPGSSNNPNDIVSISDFGNGDDNEELKLCTILNFDQASSYLVDSSQWSKYEDACKESGIAAATLMIMSLIFMVLSTMTVCFTMFMDHCCQKNRKHGRNGSVSKFGTNKKYHMRVGSNEDDVIENQLRKEQENGKHNILRYVLPTLTFVFVPLFCAIGILVYYYKCISVATPQNVNQSVVLTATSSSHGFNLGVVTCFLETLWWILFSISVCCEINANVKSSIEFEEFKPTKEVSKRNVTNNGDEINSPAGSRTQRSDSKRRSLWNRGSNTRSRDNNNDNNDNSVSKSKSKTNENDDDSDDDNNKTRITVNGAGGEDGDSDNGNNNNNGNKSESPELRAPSRSAYGHRNTGAYGNSNWMNET